MSLRPLCRCARFHKDGTAALGGAASSNMHRRSVDLSLCGVIHDVSEGEGRWHEEDSVLGCRRHGLGFNRV